MFLVHPTEGEVYRMGSHTAASSLTDLLTWRQKNKQVYIDKLVAYFSEHDQSDHIWKADICRWYKSNWISIAGLIIVYPYPTWNAEEQK